MEAPWQSRDNMGQGGSSTNFLPGGDHQRKAGSFNSCKGSGKHFYNYKSNINCSTDLNYSVLPTAAPQDYRSPSSDLVKNSNLHKEESFQNNIKDSILGDNFYKSKLKDKLYNLAVWSKGESSKTKALDKFSTEKPCKQSSLESIMDIQDKDEPWKPP